MKKIFILSCLSLFMFANEDYVPLSNFSDDKKFEYNFINNTVIDAQNIKTDSTIQDEGYSSIKTISEMEEKEITLVDEVKPIKEVKTNNEEVLKDIKKESILKDVKKENKLVNTQDKDFKVATKLSYIYLNTELTNSNNSIISDKTNEVLPEIYLMFGEHTIKAEILKSNAQQKDTNFELDTSWYKINYLYKYLNANVGLAYNEFKVYSSDSNKEIFPTFEFHLENEEDKLIAQYGLSLGKNNNVDYSYEYYLNLGYKVMKKNDLILSAGYKNKTIEDDSEMIEYKGPTLSLGGTF